MGVMFERVCVCGVRVCVCVLWYIQHFKIALSRAYIVSSKKGPFFGHVLLLLWSLSDETWQKKGSFLEPVMYALLKVILIDR